MSEEKELVWLPKELAAKINDIEGVEGLRKEILSYVDETKRHLRNDIEMMDEDILLYKAYMIQARDKFKQAKNEELEANYTLWETFDEELGETRKRVRNVQDVLEPLKKDLNTIEQSIRNLNTYKMEDVLKIVDKFNNMSDNELRVIKFLQDNFKG